MSSSKAAPAADLGQQAVDLASQLRAALEKGELERVPDEAVQALLTAAVKLYVAKRESGAEISPFVDDSVTATDVSITATSMIKAADLQLFELSLWNGFGTT